MDPEAFTNTKCKLVFYSRRNISRVRESLISMAVKSIIQACVTSKLDYCNCLLYGAPSLWLYRLRKAQNYAARIITHVREWDGIPPTLITKFYCTFTKRWLAWPLPIWLTSLYHISRERTWDQLVNIPLDTPCAFSKTYGNQSFISAAPRLWNALPENIRSSKFLFNNNPQAHLYYICRPIINELTCPLMGLS